MKENVLLYYNDRRLNCPLYVIRNGKGDYMIHGVTFLYAIGSINPKRMLTKIPDEYKIYVPMNTIENTVVTFISDYFSDRENGIEPHFQKGLGTIKKRKYKGAGVFVTSSGILHKFIHTRTILDVPEFESWWFDLVYPSLIYRGGVDNLRLVIK